MIWPKLYSVENRRNIPLHYTKHRTQLLLKGLSPVTRNFWCQSAQGNRSGAVRYFPEAVRPLSGRTCCVGSLLCRIPHELAKVVWITTATCHTYGKAETRPPEMNSDWSAKCQHGGVFAVLLFLSEEFTSHSQRRHAYIAPNVRAHSVG